MIDHDELLIFSCQMAANIADAATAENFNQTIMAVGLMPKPLRLIVCNEVRKRDHDLALKIMQRVMN